MPEHNPHGPTAVAVAFVTLGVVYGVWFAYAVFLVALVEDMGWSRSLTAGAISVMSLVHGLSGPIIGRLIEGIGPRRVIALGGLIFTLGMLVTSQIQNWWHLYLAFGLVTGFGIAMAGWVPFIVTVERCYPERLGTALGFALAGVGFGILVAVPVINLLVETRGWRDAFALLALLGPLWVLPSAWWLLRSADGGGRASAPATAPAVGGDRPHWVLASALRSPRFWRAGFAFFTGACLAQILLIHQFAFLVDHGIPKTEGSLIAGTIGVASIAGQLFWGRLSDRVGRELTYSLAAVANLLAIAALAALGWWNALLGLAVGFAVCLGVGYGANAPLYPATARDLFSGPAFPSIFGTLSISGSLGAALGAWLGGWLYDVTGAYHAMLEVSLVLAVVSPLALWWAAPRKPNPAVVAVRPPAAKSVQ
jgi:MFS family permease